MAKACCVCSESKESTENRLFSCSSHGCDVTVHQGTFRRARVNFLGVVNADRQPHPRQPKLKTLISFSSPTVSFRVVLCSVMGIS